MPSGDVLASLPLFEAAAEAGPSDPSAAENVGVTQMRLGLLVAAGGSFKKARRLGLVEKRGGDGGSNLQALEVRTR